MPTVLGVLLTRPQAVWPERQEDGVATHKSKVVV